MKTGSFAGFALWFLMLSGITHGDSSYERELKQLIQQRDQALAAAAAPIQARFKASAEQLLRRATQSNDLEAANKIKEALGSGSLNAGDTVKDAKRQLAGTTWKAVPGVPLRGGLAETLTFTEKSVEPGGYHYEADKHNTVTIVFTGGDKQVMTLTKAGTRLQFTHGKSEHAYDLVPR